MFRYSVYSHFLESEIEIPELPKADPCLGAGEISFFFGEVPLPPKSGAPEVDGQAYRLDEESILYVKDKCGRFLIRNGAEIIMAPDPGVEERVVRLSLFGPALGLLLIQRGYLVLHGGAVALPKGAAVLLGRAGSGKSTLTGELCRQGGQILTDDVVVFDLRENPFQVLPGVPILKLWPDAVDDAPEGDWTELLHPDFDKMGRRLNDDLVAGPTPVSKIFLLGGGGDVGVLPLAGTDAFRAIMFSLFAVRYGETFVSGMDSKAMMVQVADLIKNIPVRLLQRPCDRARLPETGKIVIDSLNRESER